MLTERVQALSRQALRQEERHMLNLVQEQRSLCVTFFFKSVNQSGWFFARAFAHQSPLGILLLSIVEGDGMGSTLQCPQHGVDFAGFSIVEMHEDAPTFDTRRVLAPLSQDDIEQLTQTIAATRHMAESVHDTYQDLCEARARLDDEREHVRQQALAIDDRERTLEHEHTSLVERSRQVSAELANRQQEIALREESLRNMQQTLEKASAAEKEALQAKARHMQERLTAQQQDLADREEYFVAAKKDLEQKLQEISSEKDKLKIERANYKKLVSENEHKLAYQQQALALAEAQVAARQQDASAQRRGNVTRAEDLRREAAILSERRRDLQTPAADIDTRQAALTERSHRHTQREADLDARDAAISSRDATLHARSLALSAERRKMQADHAEFASIRAREESRLIQHQRQRAAEQDSRYEDLSTKLASLTDVVHQLVHSRGPRTANRGSTHRDALDVDAASEPSNDDASVAPNPAMVPYDVDAVTDPDDQESTTQSIRRSMAIEKMLALSLRMTGAFAASQLTTAEFTAAWEKQFPSTDMRFSASKARNRQLIDDLSIHHAQLRHIIEHYNDPVMQYRQHMTLRRSIHAAYRQILYLRGGTLDGIEAFETALDDAIASNRTLHKSTRQKYITLESVVATNLRKYPKKGEANGGQRSRSQSNRDSARGRSRGRGRGFRPTSPMSSTVSSKE
mmetsp:Transcript_78270/g.91415  ORF Transcript_78270/g.91415 Transcript_78270/m.91415 type:complete len:688 (-) Transcript_78270:3097-5160(-)